MKNLKILLTLGILSTNPIFGQKMDTVLIHPENLKIDQLTTGKSQYLVYILNDKKAPKSSIQIWNIEVKKETFKGQNAITIYQNWEGEDTIVHTAKSVSLARNFRPVYHESWWNKRGKQVFEEDEKKL